MSKKIEEVTITFSGSVAMREKAIEEMSKLGFELVQDSIPWRESEAFKDIHQGTFLSGARHREGLTQVQLSERSGIPRRHISEMENGKRPIGKNNARKLAEILNINPRRLLSI